jgi:SPP1 gp7 family putative phage head morphogenesis protein
MLRYNLKALLRRLRPGMRRKQVELRPITPPATKADALNAILQRVVLAWWNASRDKLVPAYRAALEQAAAREASALVLDDAGGLGDAAGGIAQELEALILQLVPDIRAWAAAYEQFHRARFATSLTPTGVNLGTLLGPADVAETVEATVQANVALVRSISSEARTRLEGIVFRGFTARTPVRTIAKEIAQALNMGRARARRIAQDQTAKLSSQLDTARFDQAGITEFEWVHSGKVHFRPWHRERNGKRFKLRGDIRPDDMPGIPPFCGCKKRAVLSF